MDSTMVVATSASGMVFPHNEAVANAIHKPRKKKAAAKKNKGPATTTTSSGNTVSTRYGLHLFQFSILQHLQPH
jgi:hypothetical protein